MASDPFSAQHLLDERVHSQIRDLCATGDALVA